MLLRYSEALPVIRVDGDRELARFFGRQLREFRLDYRLSRRALAHKTGFSEAAIGKWERGERKPPYSFLCALAETFDVDINLFIQTGVGKIW